MINISQHAAIMYPFTSVDSALYPNDGKYYPASGQITSTSADIHSTPRRQLSFYYGGPMNSFLYLTPSPDVYGSIYVVRKWKTNSTSTQTNGFSGFSAIFAGQRIVTGVQDGYYFTYNPADTFDELGLILWQEPEQPASLSKLQCKNDDGI